MGQRSTFSHQAWPLYLAARRLPGPLQRGAPPPPGGPGRRPRAPAWRGAAQEASSPNSSLNVGQRVQATTKAHHAGCNLVAACQSWQGHYLAVQVLRTGISGSCGSKGPAFNVSSLPPAQLPGEMHNDTLAATLTYTVKRTSYNHTVLLAPGEDEASTAQPALLAYASACCAGSMAR